MKDYHHGNLKQQLLEEGLKLLSDEGYENFSIRKLARICNVSHTSPYRHFADKNDIIFSIASEIQDKFNKALINAMESTKGTHEDKLKAMGKGYVYFFLDNPDFLEVLFLTPELQDLACRKDENVCGSSLETYLSAVLPLLSENEQIVLPKNPEALDGRIPGEALRPWCLIHGLTVLLVKKAFPISTREGIDKMINEVLDFNI